MMATAALGFAALLGAIIAWCGLADREMARIDRFEGDR